MRLCYVYFSSVIIKNWRHFSKGESMNNLFPDQRINIDFDFISELEGGCLTKGYVPDPENSKSGVTIAVGFDLGARDVKDLKSMGLSENVIAKLSPYLGLQGMQAKRLLESQPLEISETEAAVINEAVKYRMTKRVVDEYNQNSVVDFGTLPRRWQTVIASVAFQYGSLSKRCKRFFACIIKQDWSSAIRELRDFGDRYPTRRNKEAVYAENEQS